MNIGVSTFPTDYSIDIAVLARRAEELGFDSLWVPEHPVLPVNAKTSWPGSPDGVIPKEYADIVDPFVALGRASAVTTDLILGTAIVLVPEISLTHQTVERFAARFPGQVAVLHSGLSMGERFDQWWKIKQA